MNGSPERGPPKEAPSFGGAGPAGSPSLWGIDIVVSFLSISSNVLIDFYPICFIIRFVEISFFCGDKRNEKVYES